MVSDKGSDNELVRLEKYIERLLAGYAALKTEKQEVEKQLAAVLEEKVAAQGETTAAQDEITAVKDELAAVQAENEKMKGELDSLDSDRGVMRDRVNSMIGQIEQWESEIEIDPAPDSSGDEIAEENTEDSEESGKSAEKESNEDRGGKAQKNLFTA